MDKAVASRNIMDLQSVVEKVDTEGYRARLQRRVERVEQLISHLKRMLRLRVSMALVD